MRYARQGLVTEEMAHVAKRENLPESLVMEGWPGGNDHPGQRQSHLLEPMAIGLHQMLVNANIGASPNASDAAEEVNKLKLAVKYGADTVMDLPRVASTLMRCAPRSSCGSSAHRHRARLSGAGERMARSRSSMRMISSASSRSTPTRGRLPDHPCRSVDRAPAQGEGAHHRHRQPWRGSWPSGCFTTTVKTRCTRFDDICEIFKRYDCTFSGGFICVPVAARCIGRRSTG